MAAPRSLIRWKAGGHARTILDTHVNPCLVATDIYSTCLHRRPVVKLVMSSSGVSMLADTGTFALLTGRTLEIRCASRIAHAVRRSASSKGRSTFRTLIRCQ
jgi:hypothetical protein